MGVYRGWSPTNGTGGEGALRVVNGSDRQSVGSSGLNSPVGGGAGARDSVLSELESPMTPRRAGGFRSQLQQQPMSIKEQPFELPGREEG